MSDVDPVEVIAEVIGGLDYDYEQRDQARRIVSAIRTHLALRRALWLALTTDNPLSRLSEAPSSPVETTGADSGPELHPRNSVAAESESEVGTNEARVTKWADLILDLTGCGVFSYENARKVMAVADAEHAELTAEVERGKKLLGRAQATAADSLVRENDWRGSYLELSDMLTNVRDERDTARVMLADVAPRITELEAEVERYRGESSARIAVKTRLQADLDEALAEVERLRVEHLISAAMTARLAARVDRFATLSSQDQDHAVKAITERNAALRTIAARDATIERLWGQLNEATNVPAIARRCSTCGEPMDSPGCCTSPESKDAYPRGFHTTYGGVGQAIQAADDRRSL